MPEVVRRIPWLSCSKEHECVVDLKPSRGQHSLVSFSGQPFDRCLFASSDLSNLFAQPFVNLEPKERDVRDMIRTP